MWTEIIASTVNWLYDRFTNREQLKVAIVDVLRNNKPASLSVELTNFGRTALYITELGFELPHLHPLRHQNWQPSCVRDNRAQRIQLPLKLDPREPITVEFDPLDGNVRRISHEQMTLYRAAKGVYAKTSTGKFFYGYRDLLPVLLRKIAQATERPLTSTRPPRRIRLCELPN